MYIADVIIYAPYRGKGYGRKGLMLLCEAAKENGIKELHDDIAIDNSSVELFLKCGFAEVLRTSECVLVKSELCVKQIPICLTNPLPYFCLLLPRIYCGCLNLRTPKGHICLQDECGLCELSAPCGAISTPLVCEAPSGLGSARNFT